jgi:hypothetical protein
MHLSLSIKIGSILFLGSLSAGLISSGASVALSSEIPEALGSKVRRRVPRFMFVNRLTKIPAGTVRNLQPINGC